MLALSRKKGEAIIIEGGIEIRIIDIQGDKVKVGINAPKDKSIYREEVYEVVKGSNTQAVQGELKDISKLKDMLRMSEK